MATSFPRVSQRRATGTLGCRSGIGWAPIAAIYAEVGTTPAFVKGRAAQRQASGRGDAPGEDHHARIVLDIEDAWRGAVRQIGVRSRRLAIYERMAAELTGFDARKVAAAEAEREETR